MKIKTFLKLGLRSIFLVACYRVQLRLKNSKIKRIAHTHLPGEYFHPLSKKGYSTTKKNPIVNWKSSGKLFSHIDYKWDNEIPDWLVNPISKGQPFKTLLPWWEIGDFETAIGDIKVIWELSRFDWALALASQGYTDSRSIDTLNRWVNDWCLKNPPYLGPNWKCGQEASIRVLHMAMAAIMLDQAKTPTAATLSFIKMHLKRIAPTISYAIAQNNNHGTSEAVALYIGGSWLALNNDSDGYTWQRLGEKWLENRARILIGKQGSFSQYSSNYHRLMLDTYVMAEVWRQHFSLPSFSTLLYQRLKAASEWLRMMVSPKTGDVPNIGANDGARLLQLADTDYRDFRPTVQFSSVLFSHAKAYVDDGPWNNAIRWLGMTLPDKVLIPPKSMLADDGGFAFLHRNNAFVLFRYPRFKFRPSQADALHIDFWLNGVNILGDAGTYSYNTEKHLQDYFNGTRSHNTIEFDGRDQMPRISRFLFGRWLETTKLVKIIENKNDTVISAEYTDYFGSRHYRELTLTNDTLIIKDIISGNFQSATYRLRLNAEKIKLKDNQAITETVTLNIDSNHISTLTAEDSLQSRYYLTKEKTSGLKMTLAQPTTLITRISWAT